MPVNPGIAAGGVLALIGGFMAAKNRADTAAEAEKQKNARELIESNIIKPAIEQGNTDIFQTFEKTLKQHYTKDQLDIMQKMAENNSQENKIKRMVGMVSGIQSGLSGGPQGPTAPQQPTGPVPAPQPEATAMTGGPGQGSLGPTNPNERPNVMPALAPMMQQDITGQTRDPATVSAEQAQIGKLQALDQASARYQQVLGGGGSGPAPVQQAQAQPVARLQPKLNITVGSKGEPSVNLTPPTEPEQQAHQAQFMGAQDWLAANPNVAKAYGPQLMTRLRAGDPKALEQVIGLQKDPNIQPNIEDVIALDNITDPRAKMEAAMRLFGDPKKAADYITLHPPGDRIDVAKLHGDVQDEVRALNAKAGRPPQFADAETYRQAQANVLARASAVRQETSDQTLKRLETMQTRRASTQAVLKTSYDLTKKLSDDTLAVDKAKTALKYLAQAGDMMFAKGSGATGIRPIDAEMRKFQGYLQQGNVGEAASLMQGWSTDVAILEQRLFGSSSRVAESIINRQEQNVPGTKDKLSVFNQKLLRISEIFGRSEKHLNVRRESAIKMLDSYEPTKPAAKALREGLYDVSAGFLRNAGEAQAQEPIPQVNFGSGDFAPSGAAPAGR